MSAVARAARRWVQDYLYALGRQLRSAGSRTSPDDFLSGAGRPVVMIPGIYEDWRFMLPLVKSLHAAGHPVHVVTLLNRNPAGRAQGNAVTLQLSREERVNERITSLYGLFDPHIPEGSVLPGARNIQLDTGGHFRILGHPTARVRCGGVGGNSGTMALTGPR
jgi:hypothetical protein